MTTLIITLMINNFNHPLSNSKLVVVVNVVMATIKLRKKVRADVQNHLDATSLKFSVVFNLSHQG